MFKDYKPHCRQVMKQDTADTINDILHGVMKPGGFGQALNIDKESAGKTGTIQNNKAVWFDGYTPELATAAMIAGANSKGTPITLNGQSVGGRYIDVAHGSTVAGPMWALAMRRVQDMIPGTTFTPPIAPEPRRYVPKAPVDRPSTVTAATAATAGATATGAAGTSPAGPAPPRRGHRRRRDPSSSA